MKPALNGNQCGFLGAGFFFVVEDEWDGKSVTVKSCGA